MFPDCFSRKSVEFFDEVSRRGAEEQGRMGEREQGGYSIILFLPHSAFLNSSETEFTQYLIPVGAGPSGKIWPRWLSHLAHLISILRMPKLVSLTSLMASLSTAA